MTDLPVQPISPDQRQRAVDRLCAHFAEDHLDTDEFERRLDLAYAAQTRHELVALEQDLPDLRPETAVEPAHAAVGGRDVAPAVAPAAVDASRPAPERDFILSVMGGAERKGTWTPAKHIRVFSMMGGASLDFREAAFASREVTVSVLSVMGGTEIIVPPGVHVESNGVAIMGGFGAAQQSRPSGPNAPVIRITGFALMGGVDILERFPGESPRDARKRIKAEKKAAKRAALPPGESG